MPESSVGKLLHKASQYFFKWKVLKLSQENQSSSTSKASSLASEASSSAPKRLLELTPIRVFWDLDSRRVPRDQHTHGLTQIAHIVENYVHEVGGTMLRFEVEVNLKIKKAYCLPKVVEGNPCLEYIEHIVFPWFKEFKVERKPKNGGDKVFMTYEEVIAEYYEGDLHPADLKPALSKALNRILQPVRDHFKNDEKAKKLSMEVKGFYSHKMIIFLL
ncbi:tyrosine--tRNA ligase [Artemisia annua]|uniref:tyrosine--tRNA ligase n=1 Tax=Artemisia annua TaxID=35608 RepID=A0A2U1Q2F9_ARTAN|nr:tyrosine--tRNA ligase [Artemisia annua]